MHTRRTGLAALIWLVAIVPPMLAAPVPAAKHPVLSPMQEPAVPTLDLADLDLPRGFPVTVSGKVQPFFPDDRPCVYGEAVYGEKTGDGWSSWSMIGTTAEALTVTTPKGTLTLTPNRMRLYLSPGYSRAFTKADAAQAPEIIREEVAGVETPVTVESFTLEPGRTYYASVDTESYFLPPEPGSPRPQRRQNRVLAVSDAPYRDGKPTLPMTPHSLGFTY